MVAAALVALLATRPPATATEVDTPLVGPDRPGRSPAPRSAAATFGLAALRGRWVVVNFFASWCPPCQQEQPELVTFAYAHRCARRRRARGRGVRRLGVHGPQLHASTGATWPAVVDPGGQIALDYGVRGPPETFIVSPDGTVVAHFDGPMTTRLLDYWLARAQGGDA